MHVVNVEISCKSLCCSHTLKTKGIDLCRDDMDMVRSWCGTDEYFCLRCQRSKVWILLWTCKWIKI